MEQVESGQTSEAKQTIPDKGMMFETTVEDRGFFKTFWDQLVIMLRRNTTLQVKLLLTIIGV